MDNQAAVDELVRRSRLADPCTLVFTLPSKAPSTEDAARRWAVAHWVRHAEQAGYPAGPVESRSGQGRPSWCGDVVLDGLMYQVHRGPRNRVLALYAGPDGTRTGRFELTDSVWLEPVPPPPSPHRCPWCELGAPERLSHVAEDDSADGYVVAASEDPDGGGRCLIVTADAGGAYDVVLDPGQHSCSGGVTECAIRDRTLHLRFSWRAAGELGLEPVQRFRLALDDDQLTLLRVGLRRVLLAGPPGTRPSLVRV